MLQLGVAIHYWNEASKKRHLTKTDTKNAPFNQENQERGWFNEIFNNSTKPYMSIIEKSVQGTIQIAKAMGEIGAMTDFRRRKRRKRRANRRKHSV